MERVKYYSNNDLSINWQLDRFAELLDSLNSRQEETLIDILELYNILLFLENKVYPRNYSTVEIENSKKTIHKILGKYFGSKKSDEILTDLNYLFSPLTNDDSNKTDDYVRVQYREDYLKCFEKYKLHNKFEEKDFEKFINENDLTVYHLLNTNYFSCVYPNLVKSLFLKEPKNFELLVNNYISEKYNYFIPKEITKDEMYKLAEEYIESNDVNSNYLNLLEQNIKGVIELNIDAKLKLKATKKNKKLYDDLFLNKDGEFVSNGIKTTLGVFTNNQEYRDSSIDFKSVIDIDWIKENSQPEELLTYIMYMDYLFNDNWIINLCSFPNLESSTLVRTFSGMKTLRHYETSFYFENKNKLILMSFNVLQEFLKRENNTRIEELLLYFFTKYSNTNFDIEWLKLEFASQYEKTNIQIKTLFTIEEQIRKQWKLLVNEGNIDHDLFVLEQTPSISSLPTFLEKKYIYLNKDNKIIDNICYLLFSDQSHIIYINEQLNDNNFLSLISNNNIKIDDFNEFQKQNVNFLQTNGIVSFDENKRIYLNDKQQMRSLILLNLFRYGVIHYHHGLSSKLIPTKSLLKLQKEIDSMIIDKLLVSENTLFSKPETKFFNYILNDSEFDNSLALRNKYQHGSVIEAEHEDYLYILVILLMYVIRINEELWLSMP